MSERVVIVGYRPHPGKESELLALSKNHWDTLNAQGLVSERTPVILQAANGTIVEIFGWKSGEAMESAHSNAVVLNMWNDYSKVCDYIPVGELDELKQLFSEFKPVN